MATSVAPRAAPHRRLTPGRGLLVLPPLLFVGAVVLGPVVLVAMYSLDLRSNIPGTPTGLSTEGWRSFLTEPDSSFRRLFVRSLGISVLVSVAATVAAYPLAYFLSFVAGRHRYPLLLLLLAPFFTSYLLRVIAWQVMLNDTGVVTSALRALGVLRHGATVPWLIYSNFSVALVLFYSWIPFVALPIFAVLENMDRRLIEAAQDLGATRRAAFLRVTLPLSLPGVIAGFVFVLIPTTGEFITPLLVGGPGSQLFGNAVQSFFNDTPDWNFGAVLASVLIGVVLVLMVAFGRYLSADLREATGTGPR